MSRKKNACPTAAELLILKRAEVYVSKEQKPQAGMDFLKKSVDKKKSTQKPPVYEFLYW